MAVVLVVDDNSFARKMMMRYVKSAGHEALPAVDGENALAVYEAEKSRIDCIITDLLMPNLDGLGLLRRLRECGAGVPKIVASADIQDAVKEDARALGALVFINKPFTSDQIEEALVTLLGAD